MKLFTTKTFNSLEDLFLDQIRDLYDAEKRIVNVLPKMAETANTAALKQAFQSHLRETEGHVNRLEQVFTTIGVEAKRETCLAMKGIVEEGGQIVDADGDAAVKDAGLIAAAQRVEHYEMAGYGTAIAFARQLGLPQVATLLEKTLNEEKMADDTLTRIAETQVNTGAAASTEV
jgi:ferritin-like metal-binding protein YciE